MVSSRRSVPCVCAFTRKTLLEAANRHKDGACGPDSGGLLSGVGDGYTERKASFSSNTNTHHRYRYKDKRCVCVCVGVGFVPAWSSCCRGYMVLEGLG